MSTDYCTLRIFQRLEHGVEERILEGLYINAKKAWKAIIDCMEWERRSRQGVIHYVMTNATNEQIMQKGDLYFQGPSLN